MRLKITVANWDARSAQFSAQAEALRAHVRQAGSDLVLLPEMPFTPWLAMSDQPVQAEWERSVREHEARIVELSRILGVAIAGSRPLVHDGANRNAAFLRSTEGYLPVSHQKSRLPAEDAYWEAHWYEPGTQQTNPTTFKGLRFGFAICTEVWDCNHARRLSHAGAEVLLAPPATPDLGDYIWVAGLRALAVQTGCYVLSSNFAYPLTEGFAFEGLSAACGPDGQLLALTSDAQPYATVEVSAEVSGPAKTIYLRYIFASPST